MRLLEEMDNKIPASLLGEILLRLPVLSLMRFKWVNKSWHALISDQNFINKHLLHAQSPSNKAKNSLLLVNYRDTTTSHYFASRLSYETLQVFSTQYLPLVYSWSQHQEIRPYIVGSCNGLVCLHDNYNLHIALWNPATQETKLIPSSNGPHLPNDYTPIFNGIGFGFDARTRDYKIIRLFIHYTFYELKGLIYTSEVYSMSTDTWRQIDSQYQCEVRVGWTCVGMRTDKNGIGSWSAKGDDWEGILSFDISNEAFFSTPQPDDVRLNNDGISQLDFFLLNESIAMAVSLRVGLFLDIWLLQEYGNPESWTKLRTVGPLSGSFRPLEFWKNDALLLETYFGRLVLFEPSNEGMTHLHIQGKLRTLQVISYMESLVSLKQTI